MYKLLISECFSMGSVEYDNRSSIAVSNTTTVVDFNTYDESEFAYAELIKVNRKNFTRIVTKLYEEPV